LCNVHQQRTFFYILNANQTDKSRLKKQSKGEEISKSSPKENEIDESEILDFGVSSNKSNHEFFIERNVFSESK
jgi:hypothetical protein